MRLPSVFSKKSESAVERGRQPYRPDELSQSNTVDTMADKEASPYATNSSSPVDLDDEPNWPKGWRPWVCLLACFFLMFNSWGLVNAYGTFGSYYLQHDFAPTGPIRINLIGAMQCFIVLGLSGVMGRLLDAGFTRWVLGVGTVFVTAGMFALGPANDGGDEGGGRYGLTLLTQGVVTALGMSCFFVASSQIAQTWFRKQKTLAVGFVACGASIAGLVYPFTTKFLLADLGFRHTAMCDAAIVCATALFAWAFAVPRKGVTRSPPTWCAVETWIDPHALRNPAWWFFTAGVAFLFLGFYAIFFNLEEWAASKGFGTKDQVAGAFNRVTTPTGVEVADDAIRTFYLLSIMNVCSSFGRIGGGLTGQKHGAVFVHWVVTAVAAILCLCMWPFVTNVAGALAFVILFGAFSGAVIGMPPASVMWILHRDPNADDTRVGQWVGMMYTVAAIPALIGPVIAAVLLRVTDFNYLTLQLWSGLCLAISACCMALAHWKAAHDEEKLWLRRRVRASVSVLTSRKPSPAASTTQLSETKRSSEESIKPVNETISNV